MDLPGTLQSALGSAYRIERQLGRGGVATVYLARDFRHDRPVALKVLLAARRIRISARFTTRSHDSPNGAGDGAEQVVARRQRISWRAGACGTTTDSEASLAASRRFP
jgi:serine/threonine protein kinase